MKFSIRACLTFVALSLCVLSVNAFARMEAPLQQEPVDLALFIDAAQCKPPYTISTAARFYQEAEKTGRASSPELGVSTYKLPSPLRHNGFVSEAVILSISYVGVVIEGLHADQLADKYRLKKATPTPLSRFTKGYARALPQAQQTQGGTVSIIARESATMPGKTILACEFISDADKKEREALMTQKK